jgi:hypothetical protein
MIQLTKEQRQELSSPTPLAIDPETQQTYLLVRQKVFERLRMLLDEDTVCTTADMLDRVMAEDDAGDSYLAELQKKFGGVP